MAKAFGGLIGEIEAGPGETRRPGGLRLRRRHPGALRRPGTVLARRLKSHPNLGERLARAGVSPGGDPVLTWKRLHAVEGRRATVIDLYRLVSEPIGLEPHQLPLEERSRLSAAIAAVFWPGFQVTAGSERTDLIRVVPYDKRWPSRFASWRHLIANSLQNVASRIDHVGSTSVPGLAAKPIIDIQVSVKDISDEELYVPKLERLGIQLRSRDDSHRYFRPFADRPRDVHVHVCPGGSNWERVHLLFRDYLRANPAARKVYANTKRDASHIWMDDGWAYTDAKSEVILDILEEAELWALESDWSP
jgi:GrpB-like predicted nucleotidyltransferase (UPF0157 family)